MTHVCWPVTDSAVRQIVEDIVEHRVTNSAYVSKAV